MCFYTLYFLLLFCQFVLAYRCRVNVEWFERILGAHVCVTFFFLCISFFLFFLFGEYKKKNVYQLFECSCVFHSCLQCSRASRNELHWLCGVRSADIQWIVVTKHTTEHSRRESARLNLIYFCLLLINFILTNSHTLWMVNLVCEEVRNNFIWWKTCDRQVCFVIAIILIEIIFEFWFSLVLSSFCTCVWLKKRLNFKIHVKLFR